MNTHFAKTRFLKINHNNDERQHNNKNETPEPQGMIKSAWHVMEIYCLGNILSRVSSHLMGKRLFFPKAKCTNILETDA